MTHSIRMKNLLQNGHSLILWRLRVRFLTACLFFPGTEQRQARLRQQQSACSVKELISLAPSSVDSLQLRDRKPRACWPRSSRHVALVVRVDSVLKLNVRTLYVQAPAPHQQAPIAQPRLSLLYPSIEEALAAAGLRADQVQVLASTLETEGMQLDDLPDLEQVRCNARLSCLPSGMLNSCNCIFPVSCS
jgi:hypothetical protein